MRVYVIAKYRSHSTSATDVSRGETDIGKVEALCDYQHQHVPLSGANEDVVDGNLSTQLTDILDVISYIDSADNCEVSTTSTSSLPGCDLQATFSNAQATSELATNYVEVNQSCISAVCVYSPAENHAAVCSDNSSENTAGTLPCATPRSPDNRLSAVFAAQQKKSS